MPVLVPGKSSAHDTVKDKHNVSRPLLQTKLYIPPIHPGFISRPRLVERLNEGLHRKLTLISAPAGFGKTTLVSNWINQTPTEAEKKGEQAEIHLSRVAWVSLDERDSDPIQFWHYVVAALQTINAGLGETVQANLKSSQLPPLEALVTVLLNDLAELQTDKGHLQPLLLVLDDYHLIANEAIHNSLNFLIDHLLSSVHLIIVTRSDPPLRLAHRRGCSEITQIRTSDLSFSKDEVAEFFNIQMGLNLPKADLTSLENRTEGWITGMQLAALSLQDQVDKHTFVSDFAGNDRYIADYLVDEVLHHQPAQIQTFLLQTSILNELCVPLCNAVTGQSQSRSILTKLERINLFLIPLDNRREWYRYHQLFADLLRQRLQESYIATDIARLHKQAYQWYDDRGELTEAVNHAMLAEDHQNAVALIEKYVEEIFNQFKLNALVHWLQALPDNLVTNRPKLCMIYGWALLATGHPQEADYYMKSIENNVCTKAEVIFSSEFQTLDPGVRGALVEVIVLRSLIAIAQFNIARVLELCQQVLPYLRENSQPYLFSEPRELYTAVVFNMGLAYEFSNEGNKAVTNFTEAVTLSREQKNINILPTAMAHLGQLQVLQGHLHQAERTFNQALQFATEFTEQSSPLVAIAETGLGKLLYERNDLKRALQHFNTGITLAKRWNYTDGILSGYAGLAQLKQAQGDKAGAMALLEELTDVLLQCNARMILPAVDTCRARLLIIQGNLTEAALWAQKSGLTVDVDLSYFQENNYLTFTRLLIAQERWSEAAEFIVRVLNYAEMGERRGRIIELLALQALVFNGQGELDRAKTTLTQALMLAEQEGYVRLFVDEGPHVFRLLCLSTAAAHSNSAYINQLLNAFTLEQTHDKGIKPTISTDALVEPLSNREIEVIQCIAEGLTNSRIAQRLFISLTTVKTHTRNIYSKLGINSRTQAVARARALGILITP